MREIENLEMSWIVEVLYQQFDKKYHEGTF